MSTFSLKAVFGMDATGVKTELKQLRREMNDAVDTFAKIGIGAAVAAFTALGKSAMALADELHKASGELGINVEKLQVLDSLALRNNESQDVLRKALEKTRLSTQEAAEGNKKLATSFQTLGVNLQNIQRLPLEQKFEAIARGLVTAENKQAAYNAIADIFGAKVGPQLINSLTELGTTGFPKAAKAAAEAGHIMSAETIVALERAQSAIDEFKRKATVAVGNILVDFRSTEGLQLLGLKLLKVAGEFGGGILDAVKEANDMIGAILKGTFRGVLNLFQDGLVTVVEGLAKMLNKVLPDKYEINIGNLEQFKSSGKSIGEEITAAIAQTSPSTFKKDFGGFWDEAVKKQEAVVDKLDKIELKPAADNLRKAGKAIEEGAQVGAASLVDAGVKVAEEIKEAARMMSSVSYTGRNYADQSDASLEGVAARLRAQLSSSYGPSKPQLADANFQSDYGAWMMAQMLKDQLAKVEGELEGRRNIRGVIARSGEDAAREKYGDTSTDKALRDMADTSTRSTNALENIERGLRTSKLIR